MVDKPYSSDIWDEGLNTPSPSFPAAGASAVPYSPGVFDKDLETPVTPPPKVVPPDTRPFLTRADETAGDAIRAFTNAVTFGNMDRLAGAGEYYTGGGSPQKLSDLVTGVRAPQSYDESVNRQVRLSEEAAKRSPTATLGGALAGGAVLPGFGGAALATKLGGKALGRFAGYGAAGAGMGAAQGAGTTYTGNLSDYAKNALIGGVWGGVLGGGIGSAVGPRPRISAAETTTTPEIKAATDFAYGKLRQNQAIYENPYLATRADQLEQQLTAMGGSRRTNPTSWDVLDDMRRSTTTPGGGNTPAELEAMRARINEISAHQDSGFDRKTGRIIKDAIDNFYTNPPLGAVRVGTETHAAAASDIATTARKLAQGGYHAETVDNILHNAALAAGKPGGAANYSDLVWQGVRGLEAAPSIKGRGSRPVLAGYSDAEKAAVEGVAYPSWLQRTLRGSSEMLGGGSHGIVNPFTLAAGGAGTGYGLGYYLGADPTTTAALGAAGPLAGKVMRSASDRMARKAIDSLYETLHQSNPLYDYRVMTAGTKPGGGLPASVNDPVRNAITTTILNQRGATLPPVNIEEQ